MSEIEAPQGTVKVGEDYKITDSKDSTWQEWYSGTNYYLNETSGEIVAIDYDGFDNARNPKSNWERETGRKPLTLEQLPDTVRDMVTHILAKKQR